MVKFFFTLRDSTGFRSGFPDVNDASNQLILNFPLR